MLSIDVKDYRDLILSILAGNENLSKRNEFLSKEKELMRYRLQDERKGGVKQIDRESLDRYNRTNEFLDSIKIQVPSNLTPAHEKTNNIYLFPKPEIGYFGSARLEETANYGGLGNINSEQSQVVNTHLKPVKRNDEKNRGETKKRLEKIKNIEHELNRVKNSLAST